MNRFSGLVSSVLILGCCSGVQGLALIKDVPTQPFVAATERLVEALAFCGAPLAAEDAQAIQRAIRQGSDHKTAETLQTILDRYCIAAVNINAESRVKVAEGVAPKELMQQGWRTFLVKVHNEAGITPELVATSPNAAPSFRRSRGQSRPKNPIATSDVAQRFLGLASVDRRPLKPQLSGLILEYRILQIYSRDQGQREARLAFDVGQGTQDIGFRNAVAILFNCLPAIQVEIDVLDESGAPTMAAFTFRDR